LRPATVEDAPRIVALVVEGFATYRAFAPPGWSAPTLDHEQPVVAATLAEPTAGRDAARRRRAAQGARRVPARAVRRGSSRQG
jgi:hypothetical protein